VFHPFQASIEKVSACSLIFFLPFAMESVRTTDHNDLTVVHKNFHSIRSERIVTMPGIFVKVHQ